MSSMNVKVDMIYKYFFFIIKVLIDQNKMYYLLYFALLFDPSRISDPQPSPFFCLIASLYSEYFLVMTNLIVTFFQIFQKM